MIASLLIRVFLFCSYRRPLLHARGSSDLGADLVTDPALARDSIDRFFDDSSRRVINFRARLSFRNKKQTKRETKRERERERERGREGEGEGEKSESMSLDKNR